MQTAIPDGTERQCAPVGGDKLVTLSVVISDQVLAPSFMAEMEKNVLIFANGQEVRAGTIASDLSINIIFNKGMHELPIGQVFGPEKIDISQELSSGLVCLLTRAQGVVGIILFPYKSVSTTTWFFDRNDWIFVQFIPVQQQRVARFRHHFSQPNARVERNHAILFHQAIAGKAPRLRIGIEGIWKVTPMHEILTDRMPPMRIVIYRIPLVEQMPSTLPEA